MIIGLGLSISEVAGRRVAAAGDVTAPTLSSPTDTATGTTTANLSVSTDEANGTLYWVVTTSATPPSAAQVKAGQNNGGAAAAASGNQVVSGTGAQAVSATGLTAGAAYFSYFMQEDAATNQSSVSSADGFTTNQDLTTGLVSRWSMNEGSGTTVSDSVSSHTITLTAGTTWASGGVSTDVTHTGSTPDHADFAVGATCTVFGWESAAVPGAAASIFGQWDSVLNVRAIAVQINTSGKLNILISADGSFTAAQVKNYVSSVTLADSTFHSWAFSFNAGTLKLYIDGVEDASVTKTTDGVSATTIFNSTAAVTLGAILASGVATSILTGTTDEIRFYNNQKSAAQIAAMHALGRP